ncbi:MAG: hypothetical protein HY335_08925 [Deinococcus sp.]|nr:hypothetical protein [Deinococcus sp.]
MRRIVGSWLIGGLLVLLGSVSLAVARSVQGPVQTVSRITIFGLGIFTVLDESPGLAINGSRSSLLLPGALNTIVDGPARRALQVQWRNNVVTDVLYDPLDPLGPLNFEIADYFDQIHPTLVQEEAEMLRGYPTQIYQWVRQAGALTVTTRVWVVPDLDNLAIRIERAMPLPLLGGLVGLRITSDLLDVRATRFSDLARFQLPDGLPLSLERLVRPNDPDWQQVARLEERPGPALSAVARSSGAITSAGIVIVTAENRVAVRGNLRRLEQRGRTVLSDLDRNESLILDQRQHLAWRTNTAEPLFLSVVTEIFPGLFELLPSEVQVAGTTEIQGIPVLIQELRADFRGNQVDITALVAPDYADLAIQSQATIVIAGLVEATVSTELQDINTAPDLPVDFFQVPPDFSILVMEVFPAGDPAQERSIFAAHRPFARE